MPFASRRHVMAACFFTLTGFVFAPCSLRGGRRSARHKEAAGAATGFVGLFA
ncbi:hypothetical protein KCP69_03335 [Salmonella enterica subsp. enterica]|nr:hypothetical protein KCP69_03335 [Salmonella enterica subsp. enterica]